MNKNAKDLIWIMNGFLVVTVTFIFCAQLFSISMHFIFSKDQFDKQIYKLPKNFFMQDLEAANDALQDFLHLKTGRWLPELPNLSKELVIIAKNERPDVQFSKPKITLQWVKGKQLQSFDLDAPIYLSVDFKTNQYQFSANNEPTDIWLNISFNNQSAVANLSMVDGEGDFVYSDENPSTFILEDAKGHRPVRATAWSIEGVNVSPLLLVKQGAQWFGKDLFMLEHGGQEFNELLSQERVDFKTNTGESYSLYVGLETTFIYDKGRWIETPPSSNTIKFPMIKLKKAQDRFLTFNLWSPYGESSMELTLSRSPSYWPDPKYLQMEFISSRRDDEAILKISTQRLRIHSGDWLILKEDSWIPLETREEILNYVARKEIVPLLVVQSIEDDEDEKKLTLLLYNSERSLNQKIEIGLKGTFDPKNLMGGAPIRRERPKGSQREKITKRDNP